MPESCVSQSWRTIPHLAEDVIQQLRELERMELCAHNLSSDSARVEYQLTKLA